MLQHAHTARARRAPGGTAAHQAAAAADSLKPTRSHARPPGAAHARPPGAAHARPPGATQARPPGAPRTARAARCATGGTAQHQAAQPRLLQLYYDVFTTRSTIY